MSTRDPRRMREILALLAQETDHLRRLHRLAHRQRRYLIRRDARRVRWTAEKIEAGLPWARELAQRRIQLLEQTFGGGSTTLKDLVRLVDTPWRETVEKAVLELAEAGDRLHQKNFQNHQLASFALDLTQEEIRLLVGSERDGDAYASDGQRTTRDLNGVVDGRA